MKATRSLYNILLIGIFLGGLAVRLIYVAQLEDKLWWVDEEDYLALSQSLASGDGFVNTNGDPTAFRPPGYPLLLAGLAEIGIDTIAEIRLVQAFISTGTLFFLFLLSLKIAGPVAALLAVAVAAGYPYFIFGVGTLYPLTAFSFLLIISVYFILIGFESLKVSLFVLSGSLMGAAVLMRTSAAVLALMVLLWLLLMMWRRPKTFFTTAFLYGLAMMLVVSPWLIRNYTVFDKPVLSTNGGRNLWLGNNPKSTVNTGSDIGMSPDLETRIDNASEIEADAIYSSEALSFIKSAPLHYMKLTLLKGLALWRVDPSPTTAGYPRYKNLTSVISIISYTPVLIFAVLGFALAGEQKKVMLMWILFALAFTALHAVYISKVRFRLPLDYFLIVMAGSALSSVLYRLKVFRFPTRFFSGLLHDQKMPTFTFSSRRH